MLSPCLELLLGRGAVDALYNTTIVEERNHSKARALLKEREDENMRSEATKSAFMGDLGNYKAGPTFY